MNKKGIFPGDSFVFGLVGLFILILILVILMPIQLNNVESDKLLFTLNQTEHRHLNDFNISENNSVIINVAYSFVSFTLYSSFEVIKVGVQYAVAHPGFVNAHTLIWIVMLSLLIPILYYVFLAGVVIFLLIREWRLTKRENNNLKKLKEKNEK